MKSKLTKLIEAEFTPKQRELVKKHGTPAAFAIAVWQCVPGEISADEAETAIQKYRQEFYAAGGTCRPVTVKNQKKGKK